jgi:hypothetical protein
MIFFQKVWSLRPTFCYFYVFSEEWWKVTRLSQQCSYTKSLKPALHCNDTETYIELPPQKILIPYTAFPP